MSKTQEITSVRFPQVGTRGGLRIRLPRRRLYQGCAILLLIPSAAAFLPVQGRAPDPTLSLVPVTTPALATASPVPLQAPVRKLTRHRLPSFAKLPGLSKLPSLSGLASWYGNAFGGHHTASGDIFDPRALTACHRSLPFGTLVRVVNLLNHRSVVVRINDRGSLNSNRVIDLSSAAAEQLDMLRSGVAPVQLEIQAAGQ